MRSDIGFKNYTDTDYEALCSFLIALNDPKSSIEETRLKLECVRVAVKGIIDFGMGLTIREGG